MEKDYTLAIRDKIPNARGTIHPTAISRGFSLPLDPTDDYKVHSDGKIVIKADREIVLTTKDMIEKLLQYNDLNYCIKGINPQKQNILRVYLTELKRSRGQQT